jgi:hypothetical protein
MSVFKSCRDADGCFRPGTRIDDAIRQLVSDADSTGVEQEAEFNGIRLWARPGMTARHVEAIYRRLVEGRERAYREAADEERRRTLKNAEALKAERNLFAGLLRDIARAYPGAVGPDTCPPSPHACDKCEIYFLLDEYRKAVER